MTKETLKVDLEKRVNVVWLVQEEKRFLLNYFNSFDTARAYVKTLSHFNINGQLLLGEVALKDLIKEV